MILSEVFLKDLKDTLFPYPDRPQTKVYSTEKKRLFEEKWGIVTPDGNSIEECIESMKRLLSEKDTPIEAIFIDGPPVQIVLPDPQVNTSDGKILLDYGFPIKDNILSVNINLTYNTEDIVAEIRSMVNTFRPHSGERGKNIKKVDMWEVYKLSKTKHMTPIEIAHKLSGIAGSTSYEPELEKYLKAVDYALMKTSAIIAQLEQLASEVTSPPKG